MIKKALFPVAGMGTRMLPLTKVSAKELLPVYNVPVLDILVEECMNAGIEEIIFVTSKGKDSIMDYFDAFPELEIKLQKKADEGDTESALRLKKITKFKNLKFSSVRQAEQLGDGHAISQARHLLSNEPFVVVFGDDLTFPNTSSIEAQKSSIQQLLEVYAQEQSSVIGVRSVPLETISSYGVVDITHSDKKVNTVKSVVEKPKKEEAPSNQAIIGKYICTPDIWDALESATHSDGGEIRLIDGFEQMLQKSIPVVSCAIEGDRFDTGNLKELLLANIYMALQSGEVTKEDIVQIIQ